MAQLTTQMPLPPASVKPTCGSVAVAIVSALLLAFPLLATAMIVPKFDEIFRDFGVALPLLARFFINVSRLLTSPVGWILVVIAIGALIVPGTIFARRSRAAAGMLLLLAMVFAGAYFVVLVASLFGPLVSMIESLQRGGAV